MAQEPSDQPSKTEQPSELTSSMASMEPLTPISLPRSTRASSTRASIWSPIFQSVTLLGTMVAMLALARYTVPSVVEEIRYAWHRGQMRAEYETGDEGLKNVSLDSLSRAYEMVTSAVGPSVVHIDVQRGPTNNPTDPLRRFLRQKFGGDESSDDSASRDRTSPQGNTNPDGSMGPGSDVDPALRFSVPPRSGSDRSDLFTIADQGSGVIVDGDGHILTNRHVISEGRAIWVTLSDGRRVEARVVGTDRLTDLAVLKVEADGLLPIRWGDSSSIRVGSPVWAVGSPFGLDRTITFGILSGKHRMVRAGARYGASARYQDFMQSDVAVNPGNSGGPLVDARGRLIGINTAIVGETYQGVSFSIPSDVSRTIYQRIRDNGHVQRGWLGVSLAEVPDKLHPGSNSRVRGALVEGFAGIDSPAELAGLQIGDVITSINEETIADVGHLMRIVGAAAVGAELQVDLRRDQASRSVNVQLGTRPNNLIP